jgi:hypothetical protein
MIVLRRAPSHTSHPIACQIRRWIRTSNDSDPKPNTTVTVKKVDFSELPTDRVLPDGSHALPLGEWLGGLQAPKDLRRGKKNLGSCVYPTPDVLC